MTWTCHLFGGPNDGEVALTQELRSVLIVLVDDESHDVGWPLHPGATKHRYDLVFSASEEHKAAYRYGGEW